MQNSTSKILYTGLALMLTGIVYNLCLLCHLPFIISVVLSIFTVLLFFNKKIALHLPTDKIHWLSAIVLLAGVVIITNKIYYLTTKHGLWDAWGIWNMHAIYLKDPQHWRNLFLNTENAHADYPLGLPGMIAFFCRLFGEATPLLVPYAIHFFITLSILVLIYLENQSENILIAGAVLMLMSTDEFYLNVGISQLADTMLAFYFLCAFVCMYHYKDDSRYVAYTAALLACCMWTKNEGIILSAIFISFYAKTFFAKRHVKYFLLGISVPLIILVLQKVFYAPENDIVGGQNGDTYKYLFDSSRYKLIYESFNKNLNEFFPIIKYSFILYLLLCIVKRVWPHKQLLIIITCAVAFFMVYVISPNDLEWHLFTSQSRLMQQLAPAAIYVISREFSSYFKLDLSTRFPLILKRPQ
jgi:hypothetical protein